MTLKDMKIKTFSLIEEYYPEHAGLAEDEDVLNKINGVVNQIQMDLMKLRKLNGVETIEIDETDSKTVDLKSTISDLYQLRRIDIGEDVEYYMPNEDIIVLPENYTGSFNVYYYKYPSMVELEPEEPTPPTPTPTPNESEGEETETTETTETEPTYDETFTFDLDADIQEIMPYGIAADLLKMDMISNYGKYFYDRYLEMKNGIDSRKTAGMIMIDGGTDV